MRLKKIDGLAEKLDNCKDTEKLREGHYALDIYDLEHPVTVEIELTAKGPAVPAAAYLEYSDEMSGYYMGERITDRDQVQALLESWVAGSGDNAESGEGE